eukprot:7836746-Ditylum_brightwellii.AAC.1
MNAIQANIDTLDSWVEQMVTNGTPNDLSNLCAKAERLEGKAFAMKKGHTKGSTEIAEEKKAQIMENKDDVYTSARNTTKMVTPKFAIIILRISAVIVEPIAKLVNRSGHNMIVWMKIFGVTGSVDTTKTSWQKKEQNLTNTSNLNVFFIK